MIQNGIRQEENSKKLKESVYAIVYIDTTMQAPKKVKMRDMSLSEFFGLI